MPKDIGPCLGRFNKWYYNGRSRKCELFAFGGCEGNGNRFSSAEECESVCVVLEEPAFEGNDTQVPRKTICNMAVEPGTCNEALMRWYYAADRGTCSQFTYSGCSGNR